MEDTGESMSPGIDLGQVEGAFVMGVGYWLTESLVYSRENGELLSSRTLAMNLTCWSFKILLHCAPDAKDILIDFRVTFPRNSSNEGGVLPSKATGEPPLCMCVEVLFAIRHALESARNDVGIKEKWFELGAPSTTEKN